MTLSYLAMFFFGLVLLASWAGWGAAIERLVLGRRGADRALHAGWGLAWTCAVGGGLNLARAISPTTTLIYVAAGVALLMRDVWSQWRGGRSFRGREWLRSRPLTAMTLVWLVIAVMLLLAYAASVCSATFNHHDDLQAYLVFPAKMIQTGEMGPDPFSERRVVSLGAMSFLHAIVLSVANFHYLHIVDPGISLLLVVGLLLGVARDAHAPPWVAALATFISLAAPAPWANVTSLVSGLALFLTLFRTLSVIALRGRCRARGAVLVALTASGLWGLKPTFIVPSALLVTLAYLLKAVRTRARGDAVWAFALAGGTTLVLLAPWMASMYQSSGTPLYPFLGRGFHGSAYEGYWRLGEGLTPASVAEAVEFSLKDLRILPVWVLATALLVQKRGSAARGTLLAFAVAALVSFLALRTAHPRPAFRYSWPPLFALNLVLLVYACGAPRVLRQRGWSLVGALALGMVTVVAPSSEYSFWAWHTWRNRPAQIRASFEQTRSPGLKKEAVRRLKMMQRSVPEGAVLLTRLRYPFLLSFERNRIFIIDFPGGASPPPGLPFFQGGERLAYYLCRQGIEHVAYDYSTQADFTREMFGDRLGPQELPWNRAQARHTFDFQDNLAELGETRYRLYDDGEVFVLDLGATREGAPLGCALPELRGPVRAPDEAGSRSRGRTRNALHSLAEGSCPLLRRELELAPPAWKTARSPPSRVRPVGCRTASGASFPSAAVTRASSLPHGTA